MNDDAKPEFVQAEPDELEENQLDDIAGGAGRAGTGGGCSTTLVHDNHDYP